MYKHYYINNNQTLNPGLHHEVHTKEHAAQLGIRSTQYVGYFASEVEAVAQAKKIYFDADGFFARGCIVLSRLNVAIPKFFKDSHTASSS